MNRTGASKQEWPRRRMSRQRADVEVRMTSESGSHLAESRHDHDLAVGQGDAYRPASCQVSAAATDPEARKPRATGRCGVRWEPFTLVRP